MPLPEPQSEVDSGGRADQAEVAEGLREVPYGLQPLHDHLLGQEPEVVRGLRVRNEHLLGFVEPSTQSERLGKPETAQEERPFLSRKALEVPYS